MRSGVRLSDGAGKASAEPRLAPAGGTEGALARLRRLAGIGRRERPATRPRDLRHSRCTIP